MMRKIFFWAHLVVGLVSGIVVLMLCITGALLAFEKQIVNFAEQHAGAAKPSGNAKRVDPAVLIANAARLNPGKVTNIEWFADSRMPVRLYFEDRTVALFNSWTGEALGRGAASLREFFRTVTALHTNLLVKVTGKGIVDIANACFVFLILSGLWIWWPRQWRWKALRSSMAIRFDVKGKARDWNWHNALGFWLLVPLLVIAAAGLVLSFKPVDQWWRKFAPAHFIAVAKPVTPPTPSASNHTAAGWDGVLEAMQQQFPGWRSMMTSGQPSKSSPNTLNVMVFLGPFGQRPAVKNVSIDRTTNSFVKVSAWENDDASNRARAVARFGHTGEIFGAWGQIIALLGCLAGVVLVYTGFALSWRRFFKSGASAK